ncbi:MAG: DUF4349 domain-containing protein [Caldilineaceae bacterium]
MLQKQRQRRLWMGMSLLLLVSSLWLSACRAAPNQESSRVAASLVQLENSSPMLAAPAEQLAAVAMIQDTMQGTTQDAGALARKVIARATMNLVVDDTEQVVAQIQAMMGAVGGYVANANLYKSDYGGDERLQGTLTLRVPADQLEAVMAQLEGLAVDVNNKTINREDVTDQYSDVQAQLRNLEATEVELREMLAEVRAKPNAKPEDILPVFNHLNNIRSQIEQLQGRKNMLDNLVGLSTLDLTLLPNVVTLPVLEAGWQPTGVARDALRELVRTLQGLGNVAIWVGIYLLPVLLILFIAGAVVFAVLRLIWRRLVRRNPMAAS